MKKLRPEEDRQRLLAEKRRLDAQITSLKAQSARESESLKQTPDAAAQQRFQANLQKLQSDIAAAQAKQRAIENQLRRRPDSIYGIERGRLNYPLAIPAPQTYQP